MTELKRISPIARVSNCNNPKIEADSILENNGCYFLKHRMQQTVTIGQYNSETKRFTTLHHVNPQMCSRFDILSPVLLRPTDFKSFTCF